MAASNGKEVTVYIQDLDRLKLFLSTFERSVEGTNVFPYIEALKKVANRQLKVLEVHLDDIISFNATWEDLVVRIESNAMRYHSILYESIDSILSESPAAEQAPEQQDIHDVLWHHRQQLNTAQSTAPVSQGAADASSSNATAPTEMLANSFPLELRRRYELRILPRSGAADVPLRLVKSFHIGKLITIKAIVVRVTEVKPLITVATYLCEHCGHEIYQEVTSRVFMPLDRCQSTICKNNSTGAGRASLVMQTRGSKFTKYQELKLQELSDQVPIGHIPRTMTTHVRGELTRQCSPGDVVTISGVFLPTPYSSSRYRVGLLADTYLEAMSVYKFKKSYSAYKLTPELLQQVQDMATDNNAYEKLARSIAPEIFGYLDVKKSLLLMMVGGVSRHLPDGMKIRGDINVCLMGDPGVAKSQMLKHISTIAPRGIYTSGKGSSGVGLTAAVLRDPVTSDLVLEGGSLVLADKGICCIDEFDKMEESDRTAIHEVMEQQTISIAKAGITTTLNARTAILAAANPAFGRYNTKRSPSDNINLPAALLSRFDLLYLMLDIPNLEHDIALADHVTYVHMHGCHPALETAVLSPDFIRAYISQARKFQPFIPRNLKDYIVTAYTNMRREESAAAEEFGYTTARTLLAILRLSTALARIRFSTAVEESDVTEAMRLMHMCKDSLMHQRQQAAHVDPISAIYEIICNSCRSLESRNPEVDLDSVRNQVVMKGYNADQMKQCLDEYERLGVWMLSGNGSKLKFLTSQDAP